MKSNTGQEAEWAASIVDMGRASVLRWSLRHDGAARLRTTLRLPAAAGVEGKVDGSPVVVRRLPGGGMRLARQAKASSSSRDHGHERLVDEDYGTEWFAARGAKEAWVSVDFGNAVDRVESVAFQWWAVSVAGDWTLESRGGEDEDWVKRAESRARPKEEMNALVRLEGWEGRTRLVRLSMRDGRKDPWDFGVYFGLRSFEVRGFEGSLAEGARPLWGGSAAGLGLWLGLEHPLSRCACGPDADAPSSWQACSCDLLAGGDVGGARVGGSLGIFEDGEHSQLRRAFAEYLEASASYHWPACGTALRAEIPEFRSSDSGPHLG